MSPARLPPSASHPPGAGGFLRTGPAAPQEQGSLSGNRIRSSDPNTRQLWNCGYIIYWAKRVMDNGARMKFGAREKADLLKRPVPVFVRGQAAVSGGVYFQSGPCLSVNAQKAKVWTRGPAPEPARTRGRRREELQAESPTAEHQAPCLPRHLVPTSCPTLNPGSAAGRRLCKHPERAGVETACLGAGVCGESVHAGPGSWRLLGLLPQHPPNVQIVPRNTTA